MKVAFRVDAGERIGSGHVMRCLTLATHLRELGAEITFLTRPQQGDLVGLIRGKGFDVTLLDAVDFQTKDFDESDYAAWLPLTELDDAIEFLEKTENNLDMVIVDHYAISSSWEGLIRKRTQAKLVAIDDLKRKHDADLIIDQTLNRVSDDYAQSMPARVLAGIKYAMLRPKFLELRNAALNSGSSLRSHRILLSMGGIDKPNATLSVLETLADRSEKIPTTVLLNSNAPNFSEVSQFCVKHPDWIQHIEYTDDVASLMGEHTLAIGAPGATSWERVCLGLPTVLIPIAKNQVDICSSLVAAGAAKVVELDEISEKLSTELSFLIDNFHEMKKSCLTLCDGKGVIRVSRELISLVNNMVRLRSANVNDINLVYEWQCKPETRKYALIRAVPTYKEHDKWMRSKLLSKKDFFYIIEHLNLINKTYEQVGVCRLDNKKNKEFVISIFLSPDFFGLGIAQAALAQINTIHHDKVIHATVLADNKASQSLFESAGYQRINSEAFIRYSSK